MPEEIQYIGQSEIIFYEFRPFSGEEERRRNILPNNSAKIFTWIVGSKADHEPATGVLPHSFRTALAAALAVVAGVAAHGVLPQRVGEGVGRCGGGVIQARTSAGQPEGVAVQVPRVQVAATTG